MNKVPVNADLLRLDLSRRGFLKTTSVLAGSAAFVGNLAGLTGKTFAQVPEGADIPKFDEETFYWASDTFNCAGMNCLHKVYVKNGRATRVSTDDTGNRDDAYGCPQVRSCPKGKGFKLRIYDPYRVKYPLERTGPRGTGQYRRVSWDYATQRVADELRRIGKQYGPHSVMVHALSGGGYAGVHMMQGMMNLLEVVPALAGPVVMPLMDTSGGELPQAILGCELGTAAQGISDFRQVAEFSNMVILSGLNPTTNTYLANNTFRLAKMRERLRERGVKVYGIDPRFNYTYTFLVDEWVPINCQTDSALYGAMIYTMIQENLIDWDYVNKFTYGWEHYQAYLLGKTDSEDPKVRRWADGVAKTPEWGEKVTGVPAAKIRQLAIEFATKKPAAFMIGAGPSRGSDGKGYYHAGITMAIVSGNVGKPGNWAGVGGGLPSMNMASLLKGAGGYMGMMFNYMSPQITAFLGALPGLAIRVVPATWLGEMLLNPEKPLPFGEKAPIIRAHVVTCANPLSCWPGAPKHAKGFSHPRVEFSCIVDMTMNTTAKFCDIVLPVATSGEREDFQSLLSSGTPGSAYHAGLVKPLWESKHDGDIWAMIAQKGGIGTAWRGRADTKDVVNLAVRTARLLDPNLPSIEEMRRNPEKAVVKHPYENVVSLPPPYNAQINHGAPFGTPSGKFEIYSETLERLHSGEPMRNMWWLNNDYPGMRDMMNRVPPIPKWTDHQEGALDPQRSTYPLQHCGPASIRRAHSSWSHNAYLDDAWGPEVVWINSADAKARNIQNGDIVQVFNGRGTVQVRAFVTNRIKQGVVSIENGRWASFSGPEGDGTDTTGAQGTLLRDCEFIGTMLPHALAALSNINTETSLVNVSKVANAPAFQGDPRESAKEGGHWMPSYPFSIDGVAQNIETVNADPKNEGFMQGATWDRERLEGKTAENNVQATITQGNQGVEEKHQ